MSVIVQRLAHYLALLSWELEWGLTFSPVLGSLLRLPDLPHTECNTLIYSWSLLYIYFIYSSMYIWIQISPLYPSPVALSLDNHYFLVHINSGPESGGPSTEVPCISSLFLILEEWWPSLVIKEQKQSQELMLPPRLVLMTTITHHFCLIYSKSMPHVYIIGWSNKIFW